MRQIDDILRDVIEALEPRETLPHPEAADESEFKLWVSEACNPGERSTRDWYAVDVDTGTLIDAAWRAKGISIDVERAGSGLRSIRVRKRESRWGWSELDAKHLRCGRIESGTYREAIVTALAKALEVDTEEIEPGRTYGVYLC